MGIMKKSSVFFLIAVLTTVIFANTTLAGTDILKMLTLEEKDMQISGQVKEVVMGLRGNGYIVLVSDDKEIKVPLAFDNPTRLKVGARVTVTGKTKTFLVPISMESEGYKVQLRFLKPLKEDVETTTLVFKVSKFEITKSGVYIVIADENKKEYRIPAQIFPVWKNLKVGNEFKITGITKTLNIPESITIDGVRYKLSSLPQYKLDRFKYANRNCFRCRKQ